jgi:hypothetical protein
MHYPIRDLGLFYYSSPPSHDVASSLRLGIMAEFDSDVDIMDIRRVEVQIAREGARYLNLFIVRGSRALEP